MERVALTYYSKTVKAVILVGIPSFLLMGAMCLWLAFNDAPTSAAVAIFCAMTVGFAGMGWFGTRLLPFLNVSCAATSEGIYIFDHHRNEAFLPWSSISHIKDWPRLQVFDIHGKDGKRVLSVDYYISNFEPFYRQVLESAPARA